MNTQPTAPLIPLGKNGLSLVRKASGAPFPYVVLGGRDDVLSQTPGGDEVGADLAKDSSSERAWFAAHVELSSPRWNDAREALVRSLALPNAEVSGRPVTGLKEDSAWDEGGAGTPVVPLAASPLVKEAVEPPVIKLRAKRRAPSLVANGAAEIVQTREVGVQPPVDAVEATLPILKDGLAPLVPLPEMPALAPSAALPVTSRLAVTKDSGQTSVAESQPGSGGVKYALGMAFLCALIAAAGYLLFLQFGPKFFDKQTESNALVGTAPMVVSHVEEARVAQVQAQQAEPEIVAPVVAETSVPAVVAGPVKPSAAFENYVAGLRVSGVLLGASPRALINGRTVYLGDVIDPVLGVRLVEVDGAARQLVFEDSTTANIRARY